MGALDVKVVVNPQDLSALHRAAKEAPGMMQVELRRGVKLAAEPIRRGVQAAAGFSSRIPGAVKTKVSFAAKGAAVSVYVDAGRAPEAAPINNKGRGGTFRHPVYGNRDNWVDQQSVPFFQTGTLAGRASADAEMVRLMDDIARRLGFTD